MTISTILISYDTIFTYISAVQIEVPVRAPVTIPANDVLLTAAVACEAVADGQEGLVVQVGADGVTLARLATGRISGFSKCESVAEKSGLASLTMESILFKTINRKKCDFYFL